jgi:cell wall assembly regulator SMI1
VTDWADELHETGADLELRPGCAADEVTGAQRSLGVRFPDTLAGFLRATDGFVDQRSMFKYAWNLDQIVAENTRAWADAQSPLDGDLIAFGEDGVGGWFCLSLDPESTGTVFHWSWIEMQPRPAAADLAAFWTGWLTGSIKV